MTLGRQALRFAVGGVFGLVVDIAVLQLALWLGTGFYAGRAVSFLAAASATWAFNRRYTFGVASGRPLAREWAHYVTLMLAGGAVNYAVSALCYAYLEPVRAWPALAVAAGSLAGMVINFASSKWLVFRPSHPT